jgi:phytanoyl-CoA hydroxylase
MLTSSQVEQFRSHGWLAVTGFFEAREVAAIRAEVERLKREGYMRNVATEGDGKTPSQSMQNLQLCPMYRHSPLFRAMPFAEHVVGAVRQLLGDPLILHLDQVFLKPGKTGMGTHWHQDNAYFKVREPLMGTAMWIAVHDATLANGTIQIIPDSFRDLYEHSRDPYSDHHIRCHPPEEQAIPIELEAGGVVFFAYGTPHSTGPNRTDEARAGVALHFLRADYAQDELLQPDRDYRPYLTGPQATGGEREYGVRIAGTWVKEVERTLRLHRASAEEPQP